METHDDYLKSKKDSLEYKALLEYSGFSTKFVKVTEYIRRPSPKTYSEIGKDDVKAKEFVDNLNKFITEAPKSSQNLTVYRGTGDYEIPIKNNIFTMKAFSGTSLSPEIAAGFSQSEDCCLYQLELPPGSPFLDIKSLSKVAEEDEILLPTNSEFEFLGKKKINIEGKVYNVFVGRFRKYYPYNEIDFSDRTKIDRMTQIDIQNRQNLIKRQVESISKLYRSDPEKVKQTISDGEQRWQNEVLTIAKKYGLSPEAVKSAVGGKRRKTRRRKRSLKKH